MNTAAQPFTHTPRPPQTPVTHPEQRWYSRGPDGHRLRWLCRGALVNVSANQDDATANLDITHYADSGSASVRLDLTPAALRELARCFIDAAADIERGHPSHKEVQA